jgi:hypothetical protein
MMNALSLKLAILSDLWDWSKLPERRVVGQFDPCGRGIIDGTGEHNGVDRGYPDKC